MGEPMPAKQKLKRKLKAILSADVEGYSLHMADDEVFTIQTLQSYQHLMSNLIGQYSGRVVDSPGDNLLAEFESAVDAVECAVEIQKKLNKENARLVEDKRLEFRVGVNIGDVVQDGDRIYGSGVNVAARIESLADPGCVFISRSTYDQVKDKVDLGFEYMGKHEVKNIKEPVQVYKVLTASESPKPLIDESPDLPDKPSIAVLPFNNMSGDPSQEYFSDGLTEQIINGLCKLKDLFVIARHSSFSYKGKSISTKQIAQELGVRYILEGSVQKAGDRVRITAQLIDAITDYHMWSENYDRDLTDIFTLQDEITMKLIEQMAVNLVAGEVAKGWGIGTTNIQAFDKFMIGLQLVSRQNEKDNAQSRKYFAEAINLDETFPSPYVWLSFSHIGDLWFGWTDSPLQSFQEAEKNVEKALELNASDASAHGMLGFILLFKRQHEAALKEVSLAIELNPNGADIYTFFAIILNFSGESEEAIRILDRVRRLDPITPPGYYIVLGAAYRNAGQYEKSIEVCKKAIHNHPDQLGPYIIMAGSYSLLNRFDEASQAVKEILRIDPRYSVGKFRLSMPFKDKEELEFHVEAMRKAGLPE
jgi:adenylate cyclase